MAANFEWIMEQCRCPPDPGLVRRAEARYDEFTISGLVPLPQTLETLLWLKEQGLRLGLVTNCAPDVPRLWSETPFADFFDHCSYSCLTGSVKPDAAIYRDALDRLGVEAQHVLYVGDGSDHERTGAQADGMDAVLVRRDLSNTYDSSRKDVNEWEGRVIGGVEEVQLFVSQ